MKKFFAVITDKAGNLRGKIALYADDTATLEEVTSAYEEQRGFKLGQVNKFGGVLKEVVEVDFSDPIVICDDTGNG